MDRRFFKPTLGRMPLRPACRGSPSRYRQVGEHGDPSIWWRKTRNGDQPQGVEQVGQVVSGDEPVDGTYAGVAGPQHVDGVGLRIDRRVFKGSYCSRKSNTTRPLGLRPRSSR